MIVFVNVTILKIELLKRFEPMCVYVLGCIPVIYLSLNVLSVRGIRSELACEYCVDS